MLKLTCNGTLLSQIFRAIDAICREVIVDATCDGLKVLSADSANVSMIDMFVSYKEFYTYMFDNPDQVEDSLTLGFPISKLIPLCSSMEKEKDVYLECDTEKLKLVFGTYEYSLRMLSVKTLRRPPASRPYPSSDCARFEIPSTVLSEIIKSSKIIEKSEFVRFITTDNSQFQYIIEGDDIGERIKSTYDGINNRIAVNAVYSLDYLKAFNSAIDLKTVEVAFKTDYFITFTYKEGGMKIEYLLAPRINT